MKYCSIVEYWFGEVLLACGVLLAGEVLLWLESCSPVGVLLTGEALLWLEYCSPVGIPLTQWSTARWLEYCSLVRVLLAC